MCVYVLKCGRFHGHFHLRGNKSEQRVSDDALHIDEPLLGSFISREQTFLFQQALGSSSRWVATSIKVHNNVVYFSVFVWENLPDVPTTSVEQTWWRRALRAEHPKTKLDDSVKPFQCFESTACAVCFFFKVSILKICTRKLWNGFNRDYDERDMITVRRLTRGVKGGLLQSANPVHLCD